MFIFWFKKIKYLEGEEGDEEEEVDEENEEEVEEKERLVEERSRNVLWSMSRNMRRMIRYGG